MIYKVLEPGTSRLAQLVDYPTDCPSCHQKTTPNYVFHRKSSDNSKIFVFLSCPNPVCDVAYVAEYERTNATSFYFQKIIKGEPKQEFFPSEINSLSPTFIKIYNESFTAEQLNLLEISGVGYRKALEFLIKDYLIKEFPEKHEEIKKMFLGKCITDLVQDTKIKEASKRAVWLGNDQTHYIKKWENKDLADLKKLIKLTINWVESEILTSDLKSSMPE